MEPVSTVSIVAASARLVPCPKHGQAWAEDEDQLIRDHYDGVPATTDWLVESLGRTRASIQMRALRLGVAARVCRPWTEEEDQTLRDEYDGDSVTVSRLASRLKRKRLAVVRRAAKLGLQQPRERDWTEEEDEVLRQEYNSHPAVNRRLARRLGRKVDALKRRAGKLGLTRKRSRPWTIEDDQTLERMAARDSELPAIAQRLARTEAACAHRLRKIGIDRTVNHLTVSDVADLLGTGHNRVRRWINRGLLKASRTSDAENAHNRVTYRELKRFVLRYIHEINFDEIEQRGSKEAFVDVLLDGAAGQLGVEGFGRGIEDAGAMA